MKALAAPNDSAKSAATLVRQFGSHPNRPVAYDQSISVAALAVKYRVDCGGKVAGFWQDFQAYDGHWTPVIGF